MARFTQRGVSQRCFRHLLLALILSGIVFVVILWGKQIHFYTNDDSAIQSILSGAQTGHPNPYMMFMNYLLCRALVLVYTAFPGPAWYLIMLEALQFLVLTSWSYLLLRVVTNRMDESPEIAIVVGLLLAFMSGFAIALLPVQRPSFTLCSASLAAMGCVMHCLLLREDWLFKMERSVLFAMSCIMLVMSCLVRFKGGVVGIALALFITGVHVLQYVIKKRDEFAWRDTVAHACGASLLPVVVALVVLAGQTVHSYVYSSPEWTTFKQTNAARSAYMDYPHDLYQDNPELYEQVGWDEPLATVVDMWYFMDERVTADAFRAIAEGSTTKAASSVQFLRDNFESRKVIFADNLFETYVALLFALGISVGVFSGPQSDSRPMAFFAVGFGVCATLYVAMQGRLIFRGVYCALLPPISVLWFLLLTEASPSQSQAFHKLGSFCGALLVVIGAAFGFAYVVAHTGVFYDCLGLLAVLPIATALLLALTEDRDASVRVSAVFMSLALAFGLFVGETRHAIEISDEALVLHIRQLRSVVDYATENPESLIIFSSSMGSTDPFQDYPSNAISWGGWTYYAPWKQEVFGRAGYPDGLTGEVFFDDTVYFACPSARYLNGIYAYLCSITNEDVSYELINNFDNGAKLYAFHLGAEEA